MPVGPGETRYAYNGDVAIAWKTAGDGPRPDRRPDLLFIPGFVSHVEYFWEIPACARFLDRLASFTRLVVFDKRGTGLSDPVDRAATLEERMDDARAVMDAAGIESAAVLGLSEGGALAILLAASQPERVTKLVLLNASARLAWAEDWPWGWDERARGWMERRIPRWGQGPYLGVWAPSLGDDAPARAALERLERLSASPGMVRRLLELAAEIDVRDIAPAVTQPTLVLHADRDRAIVADNARHTAALFPSARLAIVESRDHLPFLEGSDQFVDAIEEFLTGRHARGALDRILATVLFTDVVDSTGRAAALGDRRWRERLEDLDATVERQLARFRGRTVKQLGDGHLAAFDGPARAVRCGRALVDAARSLDLELRCGIHTGECEVRGDDLVGLAVHIGARVGRLAAPGEVLVSGTVKDLVAGSGLAFESRGTQTLKGVPGEWPLYAVSSSSSSSSS